MVLSKRAHMLALTVICLPLTACSGNAGGATTCGDYLDLSGSDRTSVVTKFLEDKGEASPGSLKVTVTKTSVLAYCSTVGGSGDPISNIDG